MADTAVTWLGHSAFRVDTPGGKRVYIDPWLSGNPKCPESEKSPERVDLIALTHGHGDHLGDTFDLAQRFECPVIALVEVRDWLAIRGLPEDDAQAGNKGGTLEAAGVKVTFVDARHSSSIFHDGGIVALGEAAGLVVEVENGTKLYFAGDTCVFGDMQLIARLYAPDIAILPIGGHFTMDPKEAAVAIELLGVERCIPCHYGTFGLLAGTPEQLREQLTTSCEILAPEPGGTVTV